MTQLGNDDTKDVSNLEQRSENHSKQDDDSKPSVASKNHPVRTSNNNDDSGDIPDVYFLSKYLTYNVLYNTTY